MNFAKSDWDRVTIGAALGLLVFWLALLLRAITERRASLLTTLQSVVAHSRTCLKRSSSPKSLSTTDTFMEGKIMQKRLGNARTVNSYLVVVLTIFFMYNALAAFRGSRSFDLETQVVHDVLIFLTLCLAHANQCIPGLLNSRTLPFCHFVLFTNLSVLGLFMAKNLSAEWYILNSTRMLSGRLIIGLYYSALPPAVFWNVLYSLSTSILVVSKPSDYKEDMGTLGLFSLEILDFVMAVVLTHIFEKLQVSTVCSEIEAQSSLRSKATAEKLLSAMCDAVVNVSPQMEIMEPCPKLDALLLRQEVPKSSECKAFDAVIHECDRTRFSEFVQSVALPASSTVDNQSIASSLHLHLRDSRGTRIAAQIFMVSYYDSLETLCYVVGITEDATSPRMPETPALISEGQDLSSSFGAREGLVDHDAADVTQTSTRESFQGNEDDMWFVIDPFSLAVIKAAPALIALAGPSIVGADMTTWIPDKRLFQSFAGFTQDITNLCLCDGIPRSTLSEEFGTLKFVSLTGAVYCANCTVKVLKSSEDIVKVQVLLRNLQFQCNKRSSSHQHAICMRQRLDTGGVSHCVSL